MKDKRFDSSLTVAVPTKLSQFVEAAASQKFTNASTYIRQSIARSLKDDGFDLNELTRVA
jgi:Arc/MetJ-type ribon-helix-helix transcriptional regulator